MEGLTRGDEGQWRSYKQIRGWWLLYDCLVAGREKRVLEIEREREKERKKDKRRKRVDLRKYWRDWEMDGQNMKGSIWHLECDMGVTVNVTGNLEPVSCNGARTLTTEAQNYSGIRLKRCFMSDLRRILRCAFVVVLRHVVSWRKFLVSVTV